MKINTSRFGSLEINPDDIILFPVGMPAFEDCRHWVLLADSSNDAVGWLQCITRLEIALAVVSPQRFVPDYRLRVSREELAPLQLEDVHQPYVLCIISKNQSELTINLKAPLVINLQRLLGRQVTSSDDQPLQFVLSLQSTQLRKTA